VYRGQMTDAVPAAVPSEAATAARDSLVLQPEIVILLVRGGLGTA
jgi:hypothetical protein